MSFEPAIRKCPGAESSRSGTDLVHGYGDLDLQLVWEVATAMAPALRAQMAILLAAFRDEFPE